MYTTKKPTSGPIWWGAGVGKRCPLPIFRNFCSKALPSETPLLRPSLFSTCPPIIFCRVPPDLRRSLYLYGHLFRLFSHHFTYRTYFQGFGCRNGTHVLFFKNLPTHSLRAIFFYQPRSDMVIKLGNKLLGTFSFSQTTLTTQNSFAPRLVCQDTKYFQEWL